MKYDNPICQRHDCQEPAWVLDTGLRINTPYCEKHAREWSDSRMTDLEASMGN